MLIERIQVKSSNVTLTLADRSIKSPSEVVEDTMMEEDKTFVTS